MPVEIKCGTTGAKQKFAIVVSKYNESITGKLRDGAVATLAAAGISDDSIHVVWVPGAWEVPLVAHELLAKDVYAGIICLGAVIKGETSHDEHINRQVSESLGALAIEYRVPVLFGILTCNTFEQAIHRSGGNVGNKGEECASAALEMANVMQRLKELS